MEQKLNAETQPVVSPPRFRSNDLVYPAGLVFLFVGVAWVFSLGMAFLILGAVLTLVNIATSFFVTWLSVTVKEKK